MSYVDAQFQRRVAADRPLIVSSGVRNLAFVGQFVDIPEDVVFTVECSVHGGMIAAQTLFHVDGEMPPIVNGPADLKVALSALRAALG